MSGKLLFGYWHDDALGLPGKESWRFVEETDDREKNYAPQASSQTGPQAGQVYAPSP